MYPLELEREAAEGSCWVGGEPCLPSVPCLSCVPGVPCQAGAVAQGTLVSPRPGPPGAPWLQEAASTVPGGRCQAGARTLQARWVCFTTPRWQKGSVPLFARLLAACSVH